MGDDPTFFVSHTKKGLEIYVLQHRKKILTK
jgi:hypothetical protein